MRHLFVLFLNLSMIIFCFSLHQFGTAIAAVFNPQSFVLSNGMKVVIVPNHRAPVVTQMVWYKVGSADEPQGKSGVAHFLEHLMFKGTKNLKSGEFSKIVARNGGRDNAFTSFDYTGYYQTIGIDRIEIVMKIEADRMRNLVFDPDEVETERQVIKEERRSRTDNSPSARLGEQLNAAMYLNYPYRHPIIGWANEIDNLSLGDLRSFYNKYYWPNNSILVVAGDITAKILRPLAEKYYGKIPAGKVPKRSRPKEPPHDAARIVKLRDKRVIKPVWRQAFLAPSYVYGKIKHTYALEVLSQIFGEGTTSRLYRSLVMEERLALSAGSYYDAGKLGPSSFVIYASPRSGISMAQLESGVIKQIKLLLNNGVTVDEVRRAKTILQAHAIYARDSINAGARVLGASLSAGQTIEGVESWPDRIGAVTSNQIHDAANFVLVYKKSVTGLLIPEDQDKERGG